VRDRLRNLTTGVAIYGAGDAAISVVNFLLLPLYVRYLTPSDYGALLILISIETFAKLINRWGLDGAFMRYYLDRDEGLPRRTFTSTIVVFLVVLDGALLIGALAASRPLAQHLFDGGDQYLTALRLMLVNSFLMAFTFVPFHVMRLGGAARSYSAFTFARSAATTALRLVLIIQMGLGVTGTYAADLIVLRFVPPRLFGVFMSVHPVFAALAGVVFLGQILQWHHWTGIALVVTANVLAVSSSQRQMRIGQDNCPGSDNERVDGVTLIRQSGG